MTEVDRTSYIGGPTLAAILGVNPYQTPLAAWRMLTKRDPPIEQNAMMRAGLLLEAPILQWCGEELGYEVQPGPFVRDPAAPLGGHLDGIKADHSEIVEAKTARSRRDWGEAGTDEVPLPYAVQALHYLGLVPSASVCHIPVLFSGLDFQLYRVERNDELIAELRERAIKWWRDHIEADLPPPPVNGTDAAILYPRDSGSVVVADDATAAAYIELRTLRQRIRADEARRDELESRLKLALGDASALTIGGETAATWKTSSSSRFDAAAFKAAQPDLYREFTRPAESRRFLLKEITA